MRPKVPKDVALAPVAVGVDLNLQRLRSKPADEIERELQLELDRAPVADNRGERAERVLALALREVDLHGWSAVITDDYAAVSLRGGSVSLDISLGAAVLHFIEDDAST
jgi:hypothetical protein